MKHTTLEKLNIIDIGLSDHDRELMRLLRRFRFMRTDQIQRLFFLRDASKRAQLSATTRVLHRLEELGLIAHLERKVRPNRGDTYGLVWHMTEDGVRLLDLGKTNIKRFRPYEPSTIFLIHTLAVVDIYIEIADCVRIDKELSFLDLEIETEAVREYRHDGRVRRIWPDMFVRLRNGEYKDHWYFEVDRGTEGMPEVINKCRRYLEYADSGKPKAEYDVCPAAVWVVPDKARKELMTKALAKYLPKNHFRMFVVITAEEITTLLIRGVKKDGWL